MPKRPLIKTNPYLLDPVKRRQMFQMTVYTSTGIEGVKLTGSEFDERIRTPRRSIQSRESVKSSGSRR